MVGSQQSKLNPSYSHRMVRKKVYSYDLKAQHSRSQIFVIDLCFGKRLRSSPSPPLPQPMQCSYDRMMCVIDSKMKIFCMGMQNASNSSHRVKSVGLPPQQRWRLSSKGILFSRMQGQLTCIGRQGTHNSCVCSF